MRRIALFLAISAICGAGLYYYTTNTVEARFLAACEDVLKDRVKAPSTFKIVKFDYSATSMDIGRYTTMKYAELGEKIKHAGTSEQWQKLIRNISDLTTDQISAAQSGETNPIEYLGHITYDAENSFGAPIRNISKCSYVDDDGNDPRTIFVRIDGKTALEWDVEAIKAIN